MIVYLSEKFFSFFFAEYVYTVLRKENFRTVYIMEKLLGYIYLGLYRLSIDTVTKRATSSRML